MEQMDEGLEEDMLISCERYQERYENKFLPRVSFKQRMGRNNNVIKLQQGMLPEFRISINPFSLEKKQFMTSCLTLSPEPARASYNNFNNNNHGNALIKSDGAIHSLSADSNLQKLGINPDLTNNNNNNV